MPDAGAALLQKGAARKPSGRKPRDHECGLKLYYQPIVQPMFAKTIGFEALIRLIDKEMRFLSPAAFIPVAEKSALNAALGNWVFGEACRTIIKMQKKEIGFDYISINVSFRHFHKKDFVPGLMKIIRSYDVEPRKICLEISEFDIASRVATTMKKINDLRKAGFWIAIDDFGGKFTALSQLGSLPADILKLNKSFVDRIVIDERTREIVSVIIDLAGRLNLEVVAKGVEDTAQQNQLMRLGCHKMQGFLFGEPMRERDILYPKKKDAVEDEQ